MDVKDVRELISLGRKAVESILNEEEFRVPEEIKNKYSQKVGVFTSLKKHPSGELRGCIGVPLPLYPLWYGVVYSSVQSAFGDPRFPPVGKEELDSLRWELSLLSPPEELKEERSELPKKIEVGRDGLIVEYRERSGLLLPQVPLEHGWDAETFLDYTCLKAGLPPGCWRDPSVKVYRFRGEVYEEVEPRGEVRRKISL